MSINYIVSEYVAKPVEDVLVFKGSLIVSHGFWIPTGVKFPSFANTPVTTHFAVTCYNFLLIKTACTFSQTSL